MADDDEAPPPPTIESLFVAYSNYNVIASEADNERHENILLSQIDFWLEKAKVLKVMISLTDTGMAYLRYKKWRLNFDEFIEVLQSICDAKGLDIELVKAMMLEAGAPSPSVETVLIK